MLYLPEYFDQRDDVLLRKGETSNTKREAMLVGESDAVSSPPALIVAVEEQRSVDRRVGPVSYTHLTLPTKA